MVGTMLRHYRLDAKIGEGGMGVVFKAWDTHLDRPVAVKAKPVADAERKRRFVHEVKAASALNHPNIVTIYDVDCVDGVDFMAMEHIDGETLERRIGKMTDGPQFTRRCAGAKPNWLEKESIRRERSDTGEGCRRRFRKTGGRYQRGRTPAGVLD
jgi:Protein kinase domain